MGGLVLSDNIKTEFRDKPFAYYEELDLPPTASNAEIKDACNRLSKKYHPDKKGDANKFLYIDTIRKTLLDDGGELGEEFSERKIYDTTSTIESYFSDWNGNISIKNKNIHKMSEIKLMNMKREKQEKQRVAEVSQIVPDYEGLVDRLKKSGSREESSNLYKEVFNAEAKAMGWTEEATNLRYGERKNALEEHGKKLQYFVNDFSDNQYKYHSKILDIHYKGPGEFTFGTDRSKMHASIIDYENKENVLSLFLDGNSYISGFSKVHFKSEHASVFVRDPNLEGAIQLVIGSVIINLPNAGKGNIIRVKAPNVQHISGFANHGDKYIPEQFATGKWWENDSALDVAVMDGKIVLQVNKPIATHYPKKDYNSRSLEDYLNREPWGYERRESDRGSKGLRKRRIG